MAVTLVVVAALWIIWARGQLAAALQSMNLMYGFEETDRVCNSPAFYPLRGIHDDDGERFVGGQNRWW